MGEQMSDQELMTGVSTKPHKRILAAMNLLEQARPPEGLISVAADTYPYVKAAIITAVREDANKIAELEGFIEYIATWNSTVKRMWKTFQEKDNETL